MGDYRHIVVPLDDSDFSRAALPYALALAPDSGTTVELVSAVDPTWARSGLGYGTNLPTGAPAFGAGVEMPGPVTDLVDATRERWASALEEAAAELRTRTPAAVRWQVVDGEPSEAIAERVAEVRADLLVMSTHGRGGLKRAWLGSVADRLIRQVAIPLLLVRPGEEDVRDRIASVASAAEAGRGAPVAIQRILLPLDGSRVGEAVLGPAVRLARRTGAEVVPFQAVDPAFLTEAPYLPATMADAERYGNERREEARRYLVEVAERLRADGVAVTDGEVVEGAPASAILERAREGIDLIAMATHGRGGLRRWVLGSVSDKVLRAGERPVLLVRPEEERSAGREER